VRGYHRIKWASLHDWQIPRRFTHVLLDECHYLSKAMLQIIDRSPQATLTLGDEYQNLLGRAYARSHVIRRRAVTQSVRSGTEVEFVVNPIIHAHPGEAHGCFRGNPFNKMEIVHYDRAAVPDAPCVIVVSDSWGLFEWAQRLGAVHNFSLLSDLTDLETFVNDCIELRWRQTRPRHGELFRFDSWDEVARAHHQKPGFRRIDHMLSRQYGINDWRKTAARIVAAADGEYALGLVEDMRNLEFDDVMLAPDIVDRAWDLKNSHRAASASSVYICVTRARRRLFVPKAIRDWIEAI
jgi:hypothetical protein